MIGPRHFVVECKKEKEPLCSYRSYRRADKIEDVSKKPCPRCGGDVKVRPR